MKRRFTAGAMLVSALALLIFCTASVAGLYFRQLDAAREELHELLELLYVQGAQDDPEQAVAAFHTAAPGKRLTLIAADGAVLADTDTDGAGDNHAGRPEVRQAAQSGWGEAVRGSATVGVPMLYVARQFSDGVVGRAAMPISSVWSLVCSSVPPLLLVLVIALSLSYALSTRVAKRLVRPLEAVGEDLRSVLEGREATALARYEPDGELSSILRYIRLLVEKFQSQLDQIKTERDKVSLILDCMDEGLVLLDAQGGVLAANHAAKALLAQSGDGAPALLSSPQVGAALQQAHREHTPVVVDLSGPPLDARELRLFLSPVTGRQYEGQKVGASVLLSDVTELKRAENIRSEFTANVSHELKTPLTSIRGSCEMLAKGMVTDPEDQKRFFTLINVEVDRLISLINDILELSALESVSIDRGAGTACPLEAAREAAQLLSAEAGAKGCAIEVRGEDVRARIDPERLKELLLNLMENAVRYGRDSGARVEVTVARQGEQVRIAVADNGIGIPEQAQPHVFERFYRVDKGRSRRSGGTGLGLAIVKHIAELYGGGVALESRPGKGSTFTVTLPSA